MGAGGRENLWRQGIERRLITGDGEVVVAVVELGQTGDFKSLLTRLSVF
jgi:hypothetical protein